MGVLDNCQLSSFGASKEMLNFNQIRKRLRAAVNEFLQKEQLIIQQDISERCMCARLAIILERGLKDTPLLKMYYADIEYNRKQGGQIKTIIDSRSKIHTITCDLIVHRRGEGLSTSNASRDSQEYAPENLLAIEMKKTSATHDKLEADRDRLMAMTSRPGVDAFAWTTDSMPEHVCGYVLGCLIVVGETGCRLEYFAGGRAVLTAFEEISAEQAGG